MQRQIEILVDADRDIANHGRKRGCALQREARALIKPMGLKHTKAQTGTVTLIQCFSSTANLEIRVRLTLNFCLFQDYRLFHLYAFNTNLTRSPYSLTRNAG